MDAATSCGCIDYFDMLSMSYNFKGAFHKVTKPCESLFSYSLSYVYYVIIQSNFVTANKLKGSAARLHFSEKNVLMKKTIRT